jgi:hypothetical protein
VALAKSSSVNVLVSIPFVYKACLAPLFDVSNIFLLAIALILGDKDTNKK